MLYTYQAQSIGHEVYWGKPKVSHQLGIMSTYSI